MIQQRTQKSQRNLRDESFNKIYSRFSETSEVYPPFQWSDFAYFHPFPNILQAQLICSLNKTTCMIFTSMLSSVNSRGVLQTISFFFVSPSTHLFFVTSNQTLQKEKVAQSYLFFRSWKNLLSSFYLRFTQRRCFSCRIPLLSWIPTDEPVWQIKKSGESDSLFYEIWFDVETDGEGQTLLVDVGSQTNLISNKRILILCLKDKSLLLHSHTLLQEPFANLNKLIGQLNIHFFTVTDTDVFLDNDLLSQELGEPTNIFSLTEIRSGDGCIMKNTDNTMSDTSFLSPASPINYKTTTKRSLNMILLIQHITYYSLIYLIDTKYTWLNEPLFSDCAKRNNIDELKTMPKQPCYIIPWIVIIRKRQGCNFLTNDRNKSMSKN